MNKNKATIFINKISKYLPLVTEGFTNSTAPIPHLSLISPRVQTLRWYSSIGAGYCVPYTIYDQKVVRLEAAAADPNRTVFHRRVFAKQPPHSC